MGSEIIVVIVVATALIFDFTNGFHDTANVVATSISTRAMPPKLAVGYASILNFVGASSSPESRFSSSTGSWAGCARSRLRAASASAR